MSLISDAKNILNKDPAARSLVEVMLLYPGFRILVNHRMANWCYRHRHFFLARYISQRGRKKTGIEIHPGATIGSSLFIDHGMGIVIGETAEIGDNCTIYHQVTLGGTGKDTGKRHPTIGNNVRVAAGSVVLNNLPNNCTAAGVPARVVSINGDRIPSDDLNQRDIPDLLAKKFAEVENRIAQLEQTNHTEPTK